MNLQCSKHTLAVGALALSRSESSHIGCRYPDPKGSIEFLGEPSGKSQASCFESTLLASVFLFRCNITTVTMLQQKTYGSILKGK